MQATLTKVVPRIKTDTRLGSAWLTEQVPDQVLEFLRSLPDTDRTPAWV